MEYIHVNKNKNYIALLHHFCEIAYDMIYKDKMLGFSANGHKMSGDELETTQRDFIKLSIELMGPSNLNHLTKFYGELDNLNDNMILWFRSKSDNDEIFDFATREQEQTDQTGLNHFVQDEDN